VVVDTTGAAEGARYSDRVKAVCEEWYPKINEYLFGTEHPFPTGKSES
jgi:hypothetical protein